MSFVLSCSRNIFFSSNFFTLKTVINKPYRVKSAPTKESVTQKYRQGKVYTSVFCSALDVSIECSLSKDDAKKWNGSFQHVVQLGLSAQEAEKVLSKAFGYTNSVYWGQERAKVIPNPEAILAILDYLRGLSFSNEDLLLLLKKFPELLGCSLESDIKSNVGLLRSTWGATGSMLKKLILRKPYVLGYNVDCKGDCMAQCTRCWARF